METVWGSRSPGRPCFSGARPYPFSWHFTTCGAAWSWARGARAAGSRWACGVPVQAVFSGRLSGSSPAPLEPTQERAVEAVSPELRILRGRSQQLWACSRWNIL